MVVSFATKVEDGIGCSIQHIFIDIIRVKEMGAPFSIRVERS